MSNPKECKYKVGDRFGKLTETHYIIKEVLGDGMYYVVGYYPNKITFQKQDLQYWREISLERDGKYYPYRQSLTERLEVMKNA